MPNTLSIKNYLEISVWQNSNICVDLEKRKGSCMSHIKHCIEDQKDFNQVRKLYIIKLNFEMIFVLDNRLKMFWSSSGLTTSIWKTIAGLSFSILLAINDLVVKVQFIATNIQPAWNKLNFNYVELSNSKEEIFFSTEISLEKLIYSPDEC